MSNFKDWPEEACLAPLTSYLVGTSGKYRPCCWFTEKLDPNHARAAEQKLTLQECFRQYLQHPSRRMPKILLEAMSVSYEMRVAIREHPEILLQTLLVIAMAPTEL